MKLNKLLFMLGIQAALFSFNSLDSLGSEISLDNRYETFTGHDIFIDDTYEDVTTKIKIEGKTLASPMKNPSFASKGKQNPIKMEQGRVINNSSTNTSEDNNYYMINSNNNEFLKLKPKTKYTLFISGKLTFPDSTTPRDIVPFYKTIEDDGSSLTNRIDTITIDYDRHFARTIVFETPNKDVESFGFYVTTATSRIDSINLYYHIVEGDVSELKIPYFEGLKSVGEDTSSNNIQLITRNKNITVEMEYGGLSDTNGLEVDVANPNHTIQDYLRTKDFVRVSPGDKLIYSNLGNARGLNIFLYDANKKFMRKHGSLDSNITIPNNCYYIKYYHYSTDSEQLQLEYGNSISSYTEPVLNTLDINLKDPLRSISDSIKDEIIYKDSRWYVNRKCKEILLNGDTSKFIFKVIEHDANFVKFAIQSLDGDSLKTGDFNTIFCDYIPLGTGNYSNREYFNISGYADSSALFVGAIPTSYLESTNSTGLANFFAKNPASIVYQLSEPKLELLKTDIKLDIYDEQTLISSESVIPPKLEITVDRTINRAIEAIEIAVNNPSIDSVSIARMWTNLLKDTLRKDALQNEINNLLNIEGLEIEKLSVSSNIDLYIKLKNTLSMSLNTNSIIFNDYSIVEDMEKLNAIEITVSSSLPYTLNAYLETPITNSDNSQIIRPNFINIKESKSNDYQPFINTNERIILNSNCNAGDGNVHNIDFKLAKNNIGKTDIYKATIKFEAIQK